MNRHYKYHNTNLLIGFLIAFCLSFSVHASIESGLQWLSTQNNPDGSYSNIEDIATPYQATTEILQTFDQLNQNSLIDVTAALAFIDNTELNNTEYLARKILVNAAAGNQTNQLVEDLKLIAGPDGGFGEFAGFQSTVIDTVFALKALFVAGQTSSQEAAFAISTRTTKSNRFLCS